jgi:hypothetical protein
MEFTEIKAGMCLRHTTTGEIIKFHSIDTKNDFCTYSFLFSETKENKIKRTRLSGFKLPILLNFWEVTKK